MMSIKKGCWDKATKSWTERAEPDSISGRLIRPMKFQVVARLSINFPAQRTEDILGVTNESHTALHRQASQKEIISFISSLHRIQHPWCGGAACSSIKSLMDLKNTIEGSVLRKLCVEHIRTTKDDLVELLR